MKKFFKKNLHIRPLSMYDTVIVQNANKYVVLSQYVDAKLDWLFNSYWTLEWFE